MNRLCIIYSGASRVELATGSSKRLVAATLIARYCMHVEISYHPALNPHTGLISSSIIYA